MRSDEQVLLATGDAQVSVVVERAQVTRVQPAGVVDQFVRGVVAPPVAPADVRTFHQDLTVVGDPYLDAGQGRSDSADTNRVRRIECCRECNFGLAVALGDRQSEAKEPVDQIRVDRRRS